MTGDKVCQLADSHIDPGEFAILVRRAVLMFLDEEDNPPMLAWEIQGPGLIFSRRRPELNYPLGRLHRAVPTK